LKFHNRFKLWPFNPSVAVDTTVTQIQRPYLSPWEYWNTEYHFYSLKYFYAVSVRTGEILFLAGPFKGAAADVTIGRQTIVKRLLKSERCWADKSFHYDTAFYTPSQGKKVNMKKGRRLKNAKIYRVRQIVERSILRVKHFSCVRMRWRYSWKLHQMCMLAMCKLTNFKLKRHPLDLKK